MRARLPHFSLLVMILMLSVVISSLVWAASAFSGFLGGGRSALGIIQSFLLCFGVAGLAYVPGACLFFMARHIRAHGPSRFIGWTALLLSVPIWGLSGAALLMEFPYWYFHVLALLIGLILLFWALSILVAARKERFT